MAGPLPHSEHVHELAKNFLSEILAEIAVGHTELKNSIEYRKIYQVALATDAVLSELMRSSRHPPPYAARTIVKSVPLLIGVRQVGPARIELRRFMELIAWDVYFSEHLVEWERFQANPANGVTRDEKDPIEYCAHRELDYYLNYAKARVESEPSGLAAKAVDDLRLDKGKLNASVHPGLIANLTEQAMPFDSINEHMLLDFFNLQRSVFKNACILLASVRKKEFNRLPAMHRAHFDWLAGKKLSKLIRSGAFGL